MFVRTSLASAIAAGLSLFLSQAVFANEANVDSASTSVAATGDTAAADQNEKKDNNAKPDDKEARELEAVQVSSKFISKGAHSAMKQDLDVRDTPYSTADYSQAFMKAIQTTNLTDLYQYMTGISRGGVTGYDISIRGFKTTQADQGAILVDGLPGLAGRFGSPPTVMAESIEVVKGPASVLYGEAQPGGFVNIVTKKPDEKTQGSLDLTTKTYDGYGIGLGDHMSYVGDLDVTGPIDKDHNLLYRVVAELSDNNTFRDDWEHARYFAPSVLWHLNESTTLRLAGEYRRRNNAYDNYLVAPNKNVNLIAPITTKYQEPGDLQQEGGRSATAALEHDFENGGGFNFSVRHVRGWDTAVGYDQNSVLNNLVTVQRRARGQSNHRAYDYFDTNYTQAFKTGAIEHKVLVGLGGGTNRTDFLRLQFFNGPTSGPTSIPGPKSINISVYDPIFGVSPPLSSFPPGPLNDRVTTESNAGAYVSDVMTLSEHWKASVGLRYTKDHTYQTEHVYPPFTSSAKSSDDVLPTAGILYQPNDNWTYYYSYSTSFIAPSPTAQAADGSNPFQPTTSHQNEAGVKASLFDGRVTSTVALFDIQKTNTLAVAACNAGVPGTCSVQVGGERSKGYEWEIDAQPLENWHVLFGLAHANAKVAKSNGNSTTPIADTRLTNAPLNSAHIWSRYDFAEGPLKNFGVGLGVTYASEIRGSQPTPADQRVLVLPGHVVTDLAFYYLAMDKFPVTLKFGNLFDKTYYEGVNSTTNELGVVPGSPRYVQLSVKVPFL